MKGNYITALYLRISDEDDVLNQAGESESISGQRLMLRNFVQTHKELSESTVIELVDDGFSGTNFERPGVKRLLEMAKTHEVNCIVVKDFSRFGRNYLEVGNYLEQIFPFLGIRFISVSDNFDSFEDFGAAGSILVGFKNIIYEAYSKDLSEKIKSVRRLKAEQGKFVTAFAPFGYRKAKENRNQLIIDEECAAIVRQIFDLFLDGMGKTAIARRLNQEHIPSPMMIRRQRQENFYRPQCNEVSHWTASTVSQILSDERYVGDAVYGKVTPERIGSKKDAHVPKEDWIIVPNAHPCIIDRERFEAAQAGKKKHNYKRAAEEKPLAKKVICRACNHALKRICKSGNTYFQCTTHRNTDRYPCFTGRICETELADSLLAYLRSLAHSVSSDSHMETKLRREPVSVGIYKELEKAEEAIENQKRSELALYQSFKAGKMEEAAYIKQAAVMETEFTRLTSQVKILEQEYQKAVQEQRPIVSADKERLQRYMPFDTLTKEIVDEFVESIYIEVDGTISIIWSFTDPFLKDKG